MKVLLVLASLGFFLVVPVAGIYEPTWDSLDSRPLPQWYDQSKIGIFVHWGVYSVPSFGSEWFWSQWLLTKETDVINFMSNNYRPKFTYQDFAPEFTAEFFEPDWWADLFKASGAKYVVLTSKHHDGYTLWPSATSYSWNSVDVGPNRDLVGDFAKSIRSRTDLHFGLYHSMYEWFNPLYLKDKENKWESQYYVWAKCMPEMLEVVAKYEPELIWSDGDWEAPDTYWNSTAFIAWLYNYSPVRDTVVVNDRWGINMTCHHGGYYTCMDRFNPGVLQPHKWENCMTLDFVSWGYRRPAKLDSIMTIEKLIQTIAETVSCGGNILVNVGATPDGRIIPIFEERLRQMGSWLEVNGEAIYFSTPWTSQNDSFSQGVWYTQRQDLNAVYAIVLKWPGGNVLRLGSLKPPPGSTICLLGVEGKLPFTMLEDDTLQVEFHVLTADQDRSKWAWVIKMEYPA